jgi:hypothetical protein
LHRAMARGTLLARRRRALRRVRVRIDDRLAALAAPGPRGGANARSQGAIGESRSDPA